MAKRSSARAKRAHNRLRYRAHNPSSTPRHYSKWSGVRKHRRRTHNPFGAFSTRGTVHDITAAAVGALGAIGTDVAMAYAAPYLPASLQSGWLNLLTRGAAAMAVGYGVGMVAGKDTGKAVAAGGLLVVAYSGLKQALAPTLGTSIKGLSGLADFGDYVPYSQANNAMVGAGMGAYMQPRIGAYMQPRRLGAYMNPAPFLGAGSSPIRAKQMAGFRGFGGLDFQGDDGSLM